MNIRAKDGCRWGLVSLGAVMLRLDPGKLRVNITRHFRIWEGDRRIQRRAASALSDNSVGRLVEDLMLQDLDHVKWMKREGVGHLGP